MEQRRNTRAGGTGDPRENPPSSGNVRHDSHMRKSGRNPTGYRTRFAQCLAHRGGEACAKCICAALIDPPVLNIQHAKAEPLGRDYHNFTNRAPVASEGGRSGATAGHANTTPRGFFCSLSESRDDGKRKRRAAALQSAFACGGSPVMLDLQCHDEVFLTDTTSSAFKAENRGGDKDDTTMCIKCAVLTTCKALNWVAVFSLCCTYTSRGKSGPRFNAWTLEYCCTAIAIVPVEFWEHTAYSLRPFCNDKDADHGCGARNTLRVLATVRRMRTQITPLNVDGTMYHVVPGWGTEPVLAVPGTDYSTTPRPVPVLYPLPPPPHTLPVPTTDTDGPRSSNLPEVISVPGQGCDLHVALAMRGGVVKFRTPIRLDLGSNTGQAFFNSVLHDFSKSFQVNARKGPDHRPDPILPPFQRLSGEAAECEAEVNEISPRKPTDDVHRESKSSRCGERARRAENSPVAPWSQTPRPSTRRPTGLKKSRDFVAIARLIVIGYSRHCRPILADAVDPCLVSDEAVPALHFAAGFPSIERYGYCYKSHRYTQYNENTVRQFQSPADRSDVALGARVSVALIACLLLSPERYGKVQGGGALKRLIVHYNVMKAN
ncbi:hypothetical protein PR048_008253 [Dryococelus australis]|uniref:Uncharacterized protein n=1 Tax=Dryococelus australis TaxID=614101 RepID=A0ABQ9HWK8_9NEOP|nr:hypothetical protein PR048_008253 [Dryococelus australis]